ncbi:MAG: FAD-binding oxidoreductase [Chloroflexota bacterium]
MATGDTRTQQQTGAAGQTQQLSQDAVAAFEQQLRGRLVRPSDPDYNDVRKVYNAMIDRHPALIAECADAADVIAGVNFARQQDMLLAVRGGGHNGGGLGVCDAGLVIDLSRMRGVRVDPQQATVVAEGGSLWKDVDHATHPFGLAVPSGIIGTTGVAGLTLGGGTGNLTRTYGLTIDNLLAVDIVLADGSLVTASEQEHQDLFWAVRGGGGNFGVVTAFHFRGRPVSTIVGGPTLWPLDQAPRVMSWFRDFMPQATEQLNGYFVFMTVPPVPQFPQELHLQKMCAVLWCYVGQQDQADAVFAPIKAFGPPAVYGVQEMPFPMLQSAFDELYPPGLQWYWRADFVNELSDSAIAEHVRWAQRLPTMHSSMHMYPMTGAPQRVGRHDTAFSYRDANWSEVIVGVDPDPAKAPEITSWTKEYWEAVHPYSAGGAYVNFMMDEGQERVQATYRDNYQRLVRVKNRYDPTNLFRVNQNIMPTH